MTNSLILEQSSTIRGKQFLVLGGGGFIGTHLCRRLANEGAKVQAFGRSRGFLHEDDDRVVWTTGSFDDRAAIARALDGVEVVFHLIATSTPESSNKDPGAELIASGLNSINLLETCRASAVRRVVFLSSGGTVYGVPKNVPISEEAGTDPISAYGIAKLTVEKFLALYRHLYGLEASILRVANPYGPLQTAAKKQGVIAALLSRALRGEPLEIWGDGEIVRDFIYIDDVIDGILLATSYNGPHTIFNLGSGTGLSINKVARDILSLVGDTDLPVLHKPSHKADIPVNVLDISRARRELNWNPRVEWLNGLTLTFQWMTDYLRLTGARGML